MKSLTKRQREIVDFIESFIQTNQYSPSYREIKQHFGFSSLGTVYNHLNGLKKRGVISHEKQGRRCLSLNKEDPKTTSSSEIDLPFIGYINDKKYIETFPQSQKLSVPKFLVPNEDSTYILRVRGNALIDELMSDGDLLLIEARHEVFAGETILGLLYDNTVIVRSFQPEGNYIRLESRNKNNDPLILKHEELMIHGALIGLFRLFN